MLNNLYINLINVVNIVTNNNVNIKHHKKSNEKKFILFKTTNINSESIY